MDRTASIGLRHFVEYKEERKKEQLDNLINYQREGPPIKINTIEQSFNQLELAKDAFEWAKGAYMQKARANIDNINKKINELTNKIERARTKLGLIDRGKGIDTDILLLHENEKELEIYQKAKQDIEKGNFSPEIIYVSHPILYGEKININIAKLLYLEYQNFGNEYKEIKSLLEKIEENLKNIENKTEKKETIKKDKKIMEIDAHLSVASLFSKSFVATYILNSSKTWELKDGSKQKEFYQNCINSIKLTSWYSLSRALNLTSYELKNMAKNLDYKKNENIDKIINSNEIISSFNIEGANAIIGDYKNLINSDLSNFEKNWKKFQEGLVIFQNKTIDSYLYNKKLQQNFLGTLIDEYGDLFLTSGLALVGLFTTGPVSIAAFSLLGVYEGYKGINKISHGEIKEGVVSLTFGITGMGAGTLKILSKTSNVLKFTKAINGYNFFSNLVGGYGCYLFLFSFEDILKTIKTSPYGTTPDDVKNILGVLVGSTLVGGGLSNKVPKKKSPKIENKVKKKEHSEILHATEKAGSVSHTITHPTEHAQPAILADVKTDLNKDLAEFKTSENKEIAQVNNNIEDNNIEEEKMVTITKKESAKKESKYNKFDKFVARRKKKK